MCFGCVTINLDRFYDFYLNNEHSVVMVHPLLKQCCYSFGLWCHQYHMGFIYGLQSVMILNLRQPGSRIQLTAEQESWIPSIIQLALCPSRIIAGILTTTFGRKWINMSLLLPNTISIIILYLASDFTTLFIAFILYGLGSGSGPLNAMSIAECCSPKIRGTMLDVTFAMFVFGLGSARFLGTFVHWRILAVISYVPLIIAFVVLLASPDSPAWLASQGRFRECTKSFNWFRGEEEKEELDKLIEWQDRVIAKKRADQSGIFRRITEAFIDKGFLKATLITFVCVVHLDVCGKLAIVSYMDVVNAITGDPERAGYYTFVIDMCNLAGTCISAAAVTQIKRRHLMFGVGVPCVTVLYAFCIVSYLSHLGLLPMKISWLPFTLMLVYLLLLNSGILGTLFTVQGEIYPLAHRGIGMGVGSVIFGVCSFVTTKMTPSLLKNLGVHGMFLVSALGVSLILIFFYFYLPETFNKTLQKIEVELQDNEEDECSNIEANEKMLANK